MVVKKVMDVKNPAVSIGMPVYNGEPIIKNAIESLLSQTFANFELIISDNASTDNTGDICRAYAERDDRIRYVRQAVNIGPTANFRYVCDEAKADYFMWAAHDDSYYDSHLKLLYDKHLSGDFILTASRPCHMNMQDNRQYFFKKISSSVFDCSRRKAFINFMKLHHWNYAKACVIYGLYKKKDMYSLKSFEADQKMMDVGADLLYLYKTMASGNVGYIEDVTWIRGERFYLDVNKTVSFKKKVSLFRRLLVYYLMTLLPSLDNTGRVGAINKYFAELESIYCSGFGGLDVSFIRALGKNKKELAMLLAPIDIS